MKKLIWVLVVLALALPMVAMGSSSYVSSFKEGTYTGTIKSVLPALNGKTATMDVTRQGENIVGTVIHAGGQEIWKWNDKTLAQQEVDPKTKQPNLAYNATSAATATAAKQTYNINCKDKAKNDCDAGIDARNYWILESAPNTIKYIVYGVPGDKKGDPAAKVELRHEFTFTKSN